MCGDPALSESKSNASRSAKWLISKEAEGSLKLIWAPRQQSVEGFLPLASIREILPLATPPFAQENTVPVLVR